MRVSPKPETTKPSKKDQKLKKPVNVISTLKEREKSYFLNP